MVINPVAGGNLGIFYKIKDENNKTRGYIYGTSHKILNDPDFKIPQRIKHKLHKASYLVLEADVTEAPKFVGLKKDEIIEQFKQTSISSKGMDLDLLVHAYDAKKPIHYLESIESQINDRWWWAQESQKKIQKIIYSQFRRIDQDYIMQLYKLDKSKLTEEERKHTEELIKFRKDDDELSEILNIIHKTSDEAIVERATLIGFFSKESRVRLIDQRNELMANKTDGMLRAGDKPFIAVGVAHLVSEVGVVNLLRKKGWTLQKQM